MAVIGIASARGAPGASTAALGLALHWPRPVLLIEADPAGGSSILAGFLRGTVPHGRGVIDVALANGLDDELDGALRDALMPLPGSGVQFLSGPATSAQAGALQGLWEPLGGYLRSLHDGGTDAIIDLGRLGAEGGPEALAWQCDLLLLAMRSDLPSVAAAKARLSLADSTAAAGGAELQALVVGPGRPYSTAEIAAALNVPVVGTIAWLPDAAAGLSHGTQCGRRARARLNSSLTALAAAVSAALAQRPALTGRH